MAKKRRISSFERIKYLPDRKKLESLSNFFFQKHDTSPDQTSSTNSISRTEHKSTRLVPLKSRKLLSFTVLFVVRRPSESLRLCTTLYRSRMIISCENFHDIIEGRGGRICVPVFVDSSRGWKNLRRD